MTDVQWASGTHHDGDLESSDAAPSHPGYSRVYSLGTQAALGARAVTGKARVQEDGQSASDMDTEFGGVAARGGAAASRATGRLASRVGGGCGTAGEGADEDDGAAGGLLSGRLGPRPEASVVAEASGGGTKAAHASPRGRMRGNSRDQSGGK